MDALHPREGVFAMKRFTVFRFSVCDAGDRRVCEGSQCQSVAFFKTHARGNDRSSCWRISDGMDWSRTRRPGALHPAQTRCDGPRKPIQIDNSRTVTQTDIGFIVDSKLDDAKMLLVDIRLSQLIELCFSRACSRQMKCRSHIALHISWGEVQ